MKSDSIVHGTVVSKSYESHEVFGVVTHVELRSERSQGLNDSQQVVDVYYPGGELQQQKIVVPGSPELEIGEQVVLVLNNHKKNLWVSNLGLGKYSLRKVGREWIMVNQIFPDHPEIGHLSLKRFVKLVEKIKGRKFVHREKSKHEVESQKEFSRRKTPSRSIASLPSEPQEDSRIPIYWLVIIFGALGVCLQVLRKKKR
ncbi:MAG: hypothetical protein CME65_09365 [Halobacteriovoraceae bacterium]|nr:hypothetical protein [Halobacteriovoraceae bacterium]